MNSKARASISKRLEHKHNHREHRNNANSRPGKSVPCTTVAITPHDVLVLCDKYQKYQHDRKQYAVDHLRDHHNLEQVDTRQQNEHRRYRDDTGNKASIDRRLLPGAVGTALPAKCLANGA